MSRITVAALLAMLLLAAPAAIARPIDSGYPAYPTPEVTPEPEVMSERITDHPVAPTAEEIKQALAQEQSYSTKGNPNVAALVREQESTSGSGNQGPATASAPAPAPAPADEDAVLGPHDACRHTCLVPDEGVRRAARNFFHLAAPRAARRLLKLETGLSRRARHAASRIT